MNIRQLIKEQLLLEKRISQMVTNLNIRMSLDVIKKIRRKNLINLLKCKTVGLSKLVN